jgi:nucleoside-diphosphate-sugar epimerase
MRILLTGATGFIGSFLAKKLISQGKEVSILALPNQDFEIIKVLEKLGVKVFYGDIRLKKTLECISSFDIVIHLAAIHDANALELKKTNFEGTRNILEMCLKYNVKKLIHMSSATVYGGIKKGTESSICKPETPYARTKLGADKLVIAFRKKGLGSIILRPPIVYGNHKKASLIKWSKLLKKKYFLIFGNGKNHVEIIHVNDVVDSVILALKKKGSGVFNVANKTFTMNQLTSILCELLKVRKPFKIPIFIANLLALFFIFISLITKKFPYLSLINVRNMKRDRSIKYDSAKSILGYEPKVQAKEGLDSMIKWAANNKLL